MHGQFALIVGTDSGEIVLKAEGWIDASMLSTLAEADLQPSGGFDPGGL